MRPSNIVDMPATVNRFWCRKGYMAITFFGRIFTGNQDDADRFNRFFDSLKNHEMIHLRQAQNTCDNWFLFYILYLWYSVCALRYVRKIHNAAYFLNPFEIEAYTHMYNLHYLEMFENGTDGWRKFAKMPLEERMEWVLKLKISHKICRKKKKNVSSQHQKIT